MGITMKDSGLQCSIFDGENPLKITKPLRLIELFAGIGAQAKALENLGVNFEHYRICEFDKYAVASYNAVHGTNFGTSDITQIHADDLGIAETDKYEYIMTYSFPCTDLSTAGKQKGMSRDSGTRSGLLWEVERLLKETKVLPQIILMENVPGVLSEKNKKDFLEWCSFLESLGYTSKYKILNAKDYGIPQNRDRVFMISWLGEYYYNFPRGNKLSLTLKDFLECSVDKKYYLSEKAIKGFFKHTQESIKKKNGFRFEPTNGKGIAKAVLSKAGSRPCDNYIALDEQNGYIRKDGTIGALTTDGSSPKHNNRIIEKVRIFQYAHGYLPAGEIDGNIFPTVRISNTDRYNNAIQVNGDTRIRKLTPKECWRLMGFDDESFFKAEKVVSNSQLYKQAGNSIVVNVLMAIFEKLF